MPHPAGPGKGGRAGCVIDVAAVDDSPSPRGGASAFEAGLDGCTLGFVAGLVEQGEHIFLVGLHAGLVERVHAQNVAADAAGALKKVDELAQVALGARRPAM